MADRFTAAFGLSFIAIGLLLWFTALCEKDGTLRRVAATFRKLPKYLQTIVAVVLVFFGLYSFAKDGLLSTGWFGLGQQTVSENVAAAGIALVDAQTDVPVDLAPPATAVTNADWLASGASEDWMLVEPGTNADSRWSFRLGTNEVMT